MMATYRPHNNQLMEWVQTCGRMRSNKAMIGRNNLRGIVSALKKGEAVWFAPDQDYGRKGSPSRRSLRWKMSPQTNGIVCPFTPSGAAMLTVTMVRKQITADIVCTSPQRWKATRQMKIKPLPI